MPVALGHGPGPGPLLCAPFRPFIYPRYFPNAYVGWMDVVDAEMKAQNNAWSPAGALLFVWSFGA